MLSGNHPFFETMEPLADYCLENLDLWGIREVAPKVYRHYYNGNQKQEVSRGLLGGVWSLVAIVVSRARPQKGCRFRNPLFGAMVRGVHGLSSG